MKKENILYLEKMGCDFFVKDEIEKVSDLNNYRYYIHDIVLKDGTKCDVIEISNGARYQTKKGTTKCVDMFGLWVSTYWHDGDGVCWGLTKIDKKLNARNFDLSTIYTQKEVLKTINSISKTKYDQIKIYERY